MLSCIMDGLYFCATWVKMNTTSKFLKILEVVKFYLQQKFFVGNNFRRQLFVVKYFYHQTKNLTKFLPIR